jgi:hypothetical protein
MKNYGNCPMFTPFTAKLLGLRTNIPDQSSICRLVNFSKPAAIGGQQLHSHYLPTKKISFLEYKYFETVYSVLITCT